MDNAHHHTQTFLDDLARLKRSVEAARFSAPTFNAIDPAQRNVEQTELTSRVGVIATHLSQQWQQHQQAIVNTNRLFERLLSDLDIVCGCFQQQFGTQSSLPNGIASEIDPDRSVGVLNLLWHTLSFTTRGNTKPLAIYRYNQPPVFTGRIVALVGHFNDLSQSDLWQEDFTRLLSHELASLYVPADPETPAVMTARHLGDEEFHFDQHSAPRQFLLKTVEMLSAGGHFHEKEFYQ